MNSVLVTPFRAQNATLSRQNNLAFQKNKGKNYGDPINKDNFGSSDKISARDTLVAIGATLAYVAALASLMLSSSIDTTNAGESTKTVIENMKRKNNDKLILEDVNQDSVPDIK